MCTYQRSILNRSLTVLTALKCTRCDKDADVAGAVSRGYLTQSRPHCLPGQCVGHSTCLSLGMSTPTWAHSLHLLSAHTSWRSSAEPDAQRQETSDSPLESCTRLPITPNSPQKKPGCMFRLSGPGFAQSLEMQRSQGAQGLTDGNSSTSTQCPAFFL